MKSAALSQLWSVHLLTLDHVAALQTHAIDPSFAAAMGIASPASAAVVQHYVEQQIFERAEGRAQVSVIKNGDDVVGWCGLHGLFEREAPELKYWVTPEQRGKGCATFGVRMMLQLAFKNLGLTRVRSVVLESNTAARRVAFKNGFQFLCVQPCRDVLGQESNELQAVYEITRTQWLGFSHAPALARLHPVLKQILQAELVAGNEIAETGGGWPEAGSLFVKLRSRFRTRPDPMPAGVTYTEPNSPHWWTADYSTGSPAHILAGGDERA